MLAASSSQRTPPAAGDLIAAIGNTPLFRLGRLAAGLPGVEIYGKAEFANPGGSVKDRPALNMILEGERSGRLTTDKILLDSTSGNTGIAYAMIAAARGYRVKLCLPANASPERKSILNAYGAEMVLTNPGEGSDGAIRRCRQIYAESPDTYFYPDQYSNPANWQAHYRTTGAEILAQTGEAVTHFVAALGTSGTFVGTTRRLKEHSSSITCISAQPASGFHGLEGLKHMPTAIVPKIYDETLADENLWIETEDAYRMVRRLAREEGLLVGISAGANVHAAQPDATIGIALAGSVTLTAAYDAASGSWSTPVTSGVTSSAPPTLTLSAALPSRSLFLQPLLLLQAGVSLWGCASAAPSVAASDLLLQIALSPTLQVSPAPPPCSSYPSCAACTSSPAAATGCGWCFSSGACVDRAALCPSGYSRDPACDACATFTACVGCLTMTTCGWCQNGATGTSLCLPGSGSGPTAPNAACSVALTTWSYFLCPTPLPSAAPPSRTSSPRATPSSTACAGINTCGRCTATGGGSTCGWCAATDGSGNAVGCVAGTAAGPAGFNCSSSQWYFTGAQACATDACAAVSTSSCAACVNAANCGWCSDSPTPTCLTGAANPSPATGSCSSVGWITSVSFCTSRRAADAGHDLTALPWAPASRYAQRQVQAASVAPTSCTAVASDALYNSSAAMYTSMRMNSVVVPVWATANGSNATAAALVPPSAVLQVQLACDTCAGCVSATQPAAPPPAPALSAAVAAGAAIGAIGGVAIAVIVAWRCRPKRYGPRKRTAGGGFSSSVELSSSSSGLAAMRVMGVAENKDAAPAGPIVTMNPVLNARVYAMAAREPVSSFK